MSPWQRTLANGSDVKCVYPWCLAGALKQAIKQGDEITVRRALVAGRDVDQVLDGTSGMTLLMWAAAADQEKIVRLLLMNGSKANIAQKNGTTALMHACELVGQRNWLEEMEHGDAEGPGGEWGEGTLRKYASVSHGHVGFESAVYAVRKTLRNCIRDPSCIFSRYR